MKQYIFTEKERRESKKEIINLMGIVAYRQIVLRKWQIRKLAKSSKN